MLSSAARQRRGAWGSTVQTAPADAERLPFADASFDLVLGHAVLHHIPDLRRAFAEFERVLAPGGTIAVRRRAVALRRPPGARAQARSRARSRRCGVARSAPAPRRRRPATGSPTPRSRGRRRPRLRARRALADRARGPASCEVRVTRRGASGELVRLDQPHARGDRRARATCRGSGASTPTAATCCCRSSTARLLEPRLPRGDLLQPDAHRAQAPGRLGCVAAVGGAS